MFLLTARQTKTAMAAATGAATYLAASELGARKLRLTALWILSSAAMAGMASVSGTTKARAAHKRIDILVPEVANKFDKTGGTVSGSVTVTGSHTIQGTLYGSGGLIDVGDHFNMQGQNLQGVNNVSGDGSSLHIATYGLNVDGGDLFCGSNDVGLIHHLAASQIGPGGTRSDLTGTPTIADLRDRCNWLKQILEDANISW